MEEQNGAPSDQPSADPPVPPQEAVQAQQAAPTHRMVSVLCGNCQANFEFPVEARTLTFGFDCTNCGAHNEVDLQQQQQQ